jgi:hypothetical protein
MGLEFLVCHDEYFYFIFLMQVLKICQSKNIMSSKYG